MSQDNDAIRARRASFIQRALVRTSLAVAAAGCAQVCLSIASDDGSRETANPLSLGETWSDSIAPGSGDFADWFQLNLNQAGELTVDVTLNSPSDVVGVSVVVYAAGNAIPAQSDGTGRFSTTFSAQPGSFDIEIRASQGQSNYQLSTGFTP